MTYKELEMFEGMKEGVAIRILDLETDNARLREHKTSLNVTIAMQRDNEKRLEKKLQEIHELALDYDAWANGHYTIDKIKKLSTFSK